MIQPHHHSRLTLVIFGVIITHFGLALAQKCYFTDQKTVANGYTPCNTSSVEHGGGTACCADGGACLTSGLCYMNFDMSINIGACTDSSWSTSNCFQKCPSDYGNANTNTLYRCNNNQWCCSRGGNITSCCDDPNVATFFPQGINNVHQIYNGSAFAAGFVLSQTSASASSSSASTAKATGAKATTTRASGVSGPKSSGSDNNTTCPISTNNSAETTKVGVGVGVGIGVPLLAALAASLFLWSKEKKRSRDFQQQAAMAGQRLPSENASVGYGSANKRTDGQQTSYEVPGQTGDYGVEEMAGQQLPWGNASVGYGSANRRTDGQQTSYEVPGQTGDYGVGETVGNDGRREMAVSPIAR